MSKAGFSFFWRNSSMLVSVASLVDTLYPEEESINVGGDWRPHHWVCDKESVSCHKEVGLDTVNRRKQEGVV